MVHSEIRHAAVDAQAVERGVVGVVEPVDDLVFRRNMRNAAVLSVVFGGVGLPERVLGADGAATGIIVVSDGAAERVFLHVTVSAVIEVVGAGGLAFVALGDDAAFGVVIVLYNDAVFRVFDPDDAVRGIVSVGSGLALHIGDGSEVIGGVAEGHGAPGAIRDRGNFVPTPGEGEAASEGFDDGGKLAGYIRELLGFPV